MGLQLRRLNSSVINFLFPLLLFLLVFGSNSFAITVTWANGAAGGPWTTGTNWDIGTPPAANDDVVINPTATFTITAVPTLTVNSLIIGGIAGSSVTLQSAGSTLTIANGALATDFSVASGVTLGVNNSFSITATAAGSVGTVSGTLTAQGVGVDQFITTAAITTFVSGSTYNYARNGCAGCLISTATYNSGSTINVTGITGATVILPGTVGGDVIWNCTGQTIQANFFSANPATFSGTVTVTSTGTGLISVGAGGARTLNIGGDLVVNGGNFTMSRGTAAQTLNVTGDIILSAGTFAFGTGGATGSPTDAAVTGNVTITGGTFDMSSGSGTKSLSVAKDWTNNGGTVNIGTTSTATFNGGSAQIIGGSASTTFNNLTSSNTSGNITLSINTSVAGTLNFTSGKIILGANDLIITSGNAVTGFNTSRYVVTNNLGFLRIIGIGGGGVLRDFPVGSSTSNYGPATITNNSGASSNFNVRVCGNVNDIGTCIGGNPVTNGVIKTWTINSSVNPLAGSGADVKLAWHSSTEQPGFVRTNCAVNRYNAGWTASAFATATDETAGIGAGYYSRNASYTNFSPFGVSSGGVPLPVEWLYFTANTISSAVKLEWATASEINNDYFTVERSPDAINFDSLFVTDAAGTSSMQNFYTAIDNDPLPDKSYYRLKQTDFNGTFSYSNTAAVDLNGIDLINIYPNPSSTTVGYLVGAETSGSVNILIIDMLGRKIVEQIRDIPSGVTNGTIDVLRFSSGTYLLRIETTNGLSVSQKQFSVR